MRRLFFATLAVAAVGAAAASAAPNNGSADTPAQSPLAVPNSPNVTTPLQTRSTVTVVTPEAAPAPASRMYGSTTMDTGVDVVTVASAPVPDTPENRRMYGSPMSNAGKRSAARGN